jgi:hypothetical protein
METIYKSFWDTVKAVLRGKLIVLNAYIKKKDHKQANIVLQWTRKINLAQS